MPQEIVSNVAPYLPNVRKVLEMKTPEDLLRTLEELHKEYVATLKNMDLEVLQTKVIMMAQQLSEAKIRSNSFWL